MFHWPIRTAVFLCVVLPIGPRAIWGQHEMDVDADQQLALVLSAESGAAASAAYRRIFQDASDDEVVKLKCHENDGLAIQAAWETAVRQLHAVKGRQSLDSATVGRFVGFVEGRLQVNAPGWWAQTLLSGEFESDDGNGQEWRFALERFFSVRRTDLGFFAPSEISLKVQPAGVLVCQGEDSQLVPETLAKQEEKSPSTRIASTMDVDYCYFAIYSGVPGPFTMSIVERRSGKAAHKATVLGESLLFQRILWSEGDPPIGQHAVGIVVGPESVFVFGASRGMPYIEGFDRRNGRCTMRFCGSY